MSILPCNESRESDTITFIDRLNDHFFTDDEKQYPAFATAVIDDVRDIAERCGVLTKDKHEQSRFANFCSSGIWFYQPTGADVHDKMVTALCFLNLLWFVDDLLDNRLVTAEEAERLVQVVAFPSLIRDDSDSDFVSVRGYAQEVQRRLLQRHDQDWLDGFWSKYIEYIFASLVETRSSRSADGRSQWTVAKYMELRLLTSGVFPCEELLPMVYDFTLDHQHRETVQRLFVLTNRIISFTNDIFSYEKERESNSLNLVSLYQAENGASLQDTIDFCADVINADLTEFRQLARVGPEEDWYQLTVFGLQHMIQGNAVWSAMTKRYCTATSPFADLRQRFSALA